MVVDGLGGDEEPFRDLGVGVTVGDQAEDVVLTASQAQRMSPGGGARPGGHGAGAQAAQRATGRLRGGGGAEVAEDAARLLQERLLSGVEQASPVS